MHVLCVNACTYVHMYICTWHNEIGTTVECHSESVCQLHTWYTRKRLLLWTGMDNRINELNTVVTSIKHRTFWSVDLCRSFLYWSNCCSKLILSDTLFLYSTTYTCRLSHWQLSTYTDYLYIWCFLALCNKVHVIHICKHWFMCSCTHYIQ